MGIIYGTIKLPPRNERYEIIENDIVKTADVCIIGSERQVQFSQKNWQKKVSKLSYWREGGIMKEKI